MTGKPAKHLAHGEWMTVQEAADRLGVAYKTIDNWRSIHRHEDGSRALLVDYWDWAMRWRRGEIPRRPGKHVRTYWVRGKQLTMKQAARKAGVSYKALHCYIRAHGCSVNAADVVSIDEGTRKQLRNFWACFNRAQKSEKERASA